MKFVHIIAGLSALVSGAVALFVLKGGALHRQSGTVFVHAMLVMSATGALMAALQPQLITINVIAGVLTFYLVLTAVRTVRRPFPGFRRIDAAAMLVALAVGVGALALALGAAARADVAKNDEPPAMYVVFAMVALLAALGDLRLMRGRPIEGPRRIVRHLWRMCFGLFVATGSFFLGQARVFPKPLRDSGLLPIPVLLVLAVMFYWLVRMSFRRRPPRLSMGDPLVAPR
jgi:uncharacterized membrane protein